MLSPAELFAVRNRKQNLPQRSHGQKDFLPDGSEVQGAKLQTCREEQWELLGEERVERLGRLGRGVWKPEEDLVELTLPAGKFWHSMGFAKEGRQCLLPEEALYLLECGKIQLFFRDLQLSVQEAYEKLVSGGSITLLHYQVYSHLKRLGYIVTRFNPSSVQTPYVRQLNLNTHDIARSRKRKRSSSPCDEKKPVEESSVTESSRSVSLRPKLETTNGDQINLITASTCCPSEESAPSSTVPIHLSSQQASDEIESHHSDNHVKSPCKSSQPDPGISKAGATFPASSRWDFLKIRFPNCAPNQPCVEFQDPEPNLIPENISGRPVDISRWLGKLNLRREKASRREQEQWDWERKYKISINADPQVKNCTNWKEYKQHLLKKACRRDQERPPHLWNSTVQPMLILGPIKSTASVLEDISVMSQSTLLDDSKRIQKLPNLPQIHFNLYQADGTSTFKKSKPGKPYAHLCVRSFDEQIPTLLTLKTLAYQSGDVPLVFALVDYGEVAFYTFKDFQLPVDVYP
ncbi:PREDICTED: tRNA-splicing endonuclease subunit Sen54 [Nanorana parkeri]|uniref:tRNA-splicing endonuclease subunit Sen54 n=1 Tax=Nanorana parkeri TaxID=125878 RepID=UPI00085445E7|nr:PREDICTED: tRNA-splicing endonuclease subunit Sen54 [Nanorana parkeri]